MEGRTFESMDYKFAFNGQMQDDEIYGEGNTYSAQYWEYDARLGRRWNLDPIDQISISNYACFKNSPIIFVDIRGDKISILGYMYDPENNSSDNPIIMSICNALDIIYNSGHIGNLMINQLVKSNETIIITPKNSKSETDPNGFNIDFNTKFDYIELAHELAHKWDLLYGFTEYYLNYKPNDVWYVNTYKDIDNKEIENPIPRAEIFAMHIENIIRAENNRALRFSYFENYQQDPDLYDKLRALNNDGTSIYFKEYNITKIQGKFITLGYNFGNSRSKYFQAYKIKISNFKYKKSSPPKVKDPGGIINDPFR